MEDTLRVLQSYLRVLSYVLILVLMEDTLREYEDKNCILSSRPVLILVLMEDTLRVHRELG